MPKAAIAKPTKKQRRGFSAMSPEKQKEIARMGGLKVAKKKGHMSKIGSKGGSNSHAEVNRLLESARAKVSKKRK